MQKMKLFLFVSILSLFFIGPLPAEAPGGNLTPVGYWKTIDDKTGEVKSIVKIWIAEDGILKGRVEKVFPKEGEDPNPICDKCKGDRKDQPVLGMEFLWGFKGFGAVWKNGEVLDPENGKIYSCQLEVIENGKKLKVFGYIRIIFKIGRSQIWIREKEGS
jgi:uncharacterized protein (DUF2147 family)